MVERGRRQDLDGPSGQQSRDLRFRRWASDDHRSTGLPRSGPVEHARVDPFTPPYECGIRLKKGDRMPLVSRRRLAAATIVLGVGVASLSYATAQAAPITANLVGPSTQNVLVLLRNQHTNL